MAIRSAPGKRALDVAVAFVSLLALSPVLAVIGLLTWAQDRHSPLYIAPRAARGGGTFRMVKFRSMKVGADRSGVDSTSATDRRITPLGNFLRRFKLDELPQLWNVLIGDMSLVGPRPQVMREVALYTRAEQELLDARPGITDISSIVFADEADILAPHRDADLAYNQLIRPWKSRLGIVYVRNQSVWLDLQLIFWTACALASRRRALEGIARLLHRLGADAETRAVARRQSELVPSVPPGATAVVAHR